MNDKILNFDIANADDEGPVDRGLIIKHLQQVPNHIMSEYLGVVDNYLEDIAVIRNVISSIDRPHSFRYFLDGLTQNQLNNLNSIALILASVEPEKHIRELLKLSFGISNPTPESFLKSLKLIDQLKALDKAEAEKLVWLSKFMGMISDIIITLRLGEDFESLALCPLSTLIESDIDKLIEIASKKFTNGYNA
jgi:hypothetical protein